MEQTETDQRGGGRGIKVERRGRNSTKNEPSSQFSSFFFPLGEKLAFKLSKGVKINAHKN